MEKALGNDPNGTGDPVRSLCHSEIPLFPIVRCLSGLKQGRDPSNNKNNSFQSHKENLKHTYCAQYESISHNFTFKSQIRSIVQCLYLCFHIEIKTYIKINMRKTHYIRYTFLQASAGTLKTQIRISHAIIIQQVIEEIGRAHV